MKNNKVLISLEPRVLEEIDRRCAGPVQLFHPSGRANWIRELIYRELGWEIPGKKKSVSDRSLNLPLHLVDISDLQPIEELCVLLGLKGFSFHKIARYCNKERIPNPTGSKTWYGPQVEKILNNVIAKNLLKTASV